MEEQLISIETAKLAKENGFELYKYLIIDDENPKNLNSNYNPRKYQPWYFNLTQSILQRWLRENYNIHIEIQYSFDHNRYMFIVHSFKGDRINAELLFLQEDSKKYLKYETYEEALEAALLEGLKLIK
jgi:hypothetical protein